jgi:hypothetical protein
MAVDLEQFYNEDPRRRHSEELEFGREWSNEGGRCEVSWVEATGELYAMVEPTAQYTADGVGGMHPGSMTAHDLVIEVLGVIPGRDAITHVMSGWEEAMTQPNSLGWVRERVANAASEMGDSPAAPSDDMPPH